MKKIIFTLFVACCLFSACTSTKKASSMTNPSKLTGNWELNYMSGSQIAFDGLYPNKKPTITFDTINNRVSGNTSCNNFSGSLKVYDNQINFTEPMVMTKKMCLDGNGETVFLETLKKINSYSITDEGKTLNFITGDIAMMRFTKK
jgi:heat shock protein HslJ